ncbi:hypothetical protein [Microbacterium sp. R86528]|uniref:hypothetical protein n=1 Tax=Microbacterium sp. R86528 TaxID=3093864 RepID=UPI0037C92C9C
MREMKKQALDVFGTRAKFAERPGERDDTVGRYFRNERQMPTDVLISAIAALGVTPMDFFARAFATRAVPPTRD